MNRISGVLGGISYHQFCVLATNDPNPMPEAGVADEISPHTLVVPTASGVCVSTGIAMGLIKLTIELLEEEPDAIDDREQWDAVSDVSFQAACAQAHVLVLMDWTPAPFGSFGLPLGPGWYRLRGHASGRSLDFDDVVSENPRESHLLQLWRTERFEPAQHHRVDDRWALQGQWSSDQDMPRE
jgi:hypothetical protein